jgi:hypothetical protein
LQQGKVRIVISVIIGIDPFCPSLYIERVKVKHHNVINENLAASLRPAGTPLACFTRGLAVFDESESMKAKQYQPKTGQPCGCKAGQERDNCPKCEGTGMRIDFAAIRARNLVDEVPGLQAPTQRQHTPGPFEYYKSPAGLRGIVDARQRRLGSVYGLCDGVDNDARNAEADANGLLFAAAPDLLAALEAIVRLAEEHNKHDDPMSMIARAAIAKAERGAAVKRATIEYVGEQGPHTPWGVAESATVFAPGIVFYTTASHGGFYLAPERNAALLAKFPGFRRFSGSVGWYEEDCDWSAVALAFPDAFPGVNQTEAQGVFDRYCSKRCLTAAAL